MNNLGKFIIGLIISALGLWYAFHDLDLEELLFYISQVDLVYIMISMIIMIASVALRAYRWKLILSPLQQFSFNPLFGSTMIGYFGNGVLPFRLGEVLRGYALSRTNKISTSSAFGTIVLERLIDLMSLAVFMIFFAFFSPLMEWSGNVLIGLVILTLGGLLFIIWLGKSHSQFHEKVVHWKIFRSKTGQQILKSLQNVLAGLTSIRQTKHTFQLIFLSILLWIMYYYSVDMVVRATGIEIDWVAIGIVLIATTLAITVPSAPGYVGTYHAAAVYVLVNMFQAGLTESQAFAVLIHAIGFVPLVLIGFVYFLNSSIHFRDVKEEEIIT